MRRRFPGTESPRVIARISGGAIRGNYRAIAAQVRGLRILPMIKANAYGHGAIWAAREFLPMPGLYGLGVATLGEGLELRQQGRVPSRVPILVFSGISPYTEERGLFCLRHGLTPVISSLQDWQAFSRGRLAGRLPYELKFNTGMNRLGLPPELAPRLAREFAKAPKLAPRGVLSHLAIAENPNSPLSRRQAGSFLAMRAALSGVLEGRSVFHLGNSSAVWNAREWRLGELTDVVRPGISLYGVPPWSGAPGRGLRPVMNLEARVIEARELRAGDAVGYGGVCKITRTGTRVVILAAGYGDGLHRALSHCGVIRVSGNSRLQGRFAGRISMDLSAGRFPSRFLPEVGDYVRVLGQGIDPWAQASLAGTVPYELLTSVPSSGRVHRQYVR